MGFGAKKQTVGYKYYIGMHLAVCHGPVDAVTQITVGDRVAWTGNVTATQDIAVSAEGLFGGEKREGGVSGTVGFKFGDSGQAQDAYLAARLGGNVPAFRGILSFVLKQVYIGTNPYLKPWAFTVKRLPAAGWYDVKRDISGHANAAHIVYECLTNRDWGMGYPASALDDAAFRAAADTLHAEEFGLSLLFNQQGPIHEFIQTIMDHIGGVFRLDNRTGLFTLKLIRDDYTPAGLPLYDESNVIALDSYQRAAWGETVNEIVLKYTKANEQETAITVQDLGNIQVQGAVVSETVSYPGIRSDAIAQRVAMRELKARSTPLSRIKLTVNRTAWNLHPGDGFRFSWAKLGLSEVVYRVGSFQSGTLQDGKITIEAVEDVFGLPTNVYAAQQPVGWVSPNNSPTASPYRVLYEAPFYDLVRLMGQNDAEALAVDAGYLIAAGVRPSDDAFNYALLTRTGAAAYAEAGTGDFCPSCLIAADLPPAVSSTVAYTDGVDMEDVAAGEYALIGTELVAVTAIAPDADPSTGSITVDRGVLDTVPVAHGAGARLFFAYHSHSYDPTEYADGEVVDAKLLPVTGLGALAEGAAPSNSLTLDQRPARPYPPGNFQLNAARWPMAIAGPLTVSWAHRDRRQQTAGFIKQDAGNIGPEASVTYTVKLYKEDGALAKTAAGLTGTSYAWSTESTDAGSYQGNLRATVEGVRAGLSSWQIQDHTVARVGYGMNFGEWWGGSGALSFAGWTTAYQYGDSFVAGPDLNSHRYWRLRAWTDLSGYLEVSEIQLWSGGANQNAAATVSSNPVPNGGALADVLDDNTSTRCYWTDVSLPIITWDFGGSGIVIDGVKLGGFDNGSRYPTGFTLEYSDDNANWSLKAAPSGLTYPGHNTLSALIPV
ncbi:phage tail protein [Methylocaldum sp.]|uniref:phage tail protein n=1 Tax=Methylocaldum sp. TaxID=1969727 RepID=UPI002D295180|nr:phage tail protein [Methylocaldum sp.]HYE35515.1 phage tail protein [Methylocaldum sp.]